MCIRDSAGTARAARATTTTAGSSSTTRTCGRCRSDRPGDELSTATLRTTRSVNDVLLTLVRITHRNAAGWTSRHVALPDRSAGLFVVRMKNRGAARAFGCEEKILRDQEMRLRRRTRRRCVLHAGGFKRGLDVRGRIAVGYGEC